MDTALTTMAIARTVLAGSRPARASSPAAAARSAADSTWAISSPGGGQIQAGRRVVGLCGQARRYQFHLPPGPEPGRGGRAA